MERKADNNEPLAALAFKIATDPFVGKLTFIRVYSGVLKSGSYVINSTSDQKERIGRLVKMHANTREEIEKVEAGDIATDARVFVFEGDPTTQPMKATYLLAQEVSDFSVGGKAIHTSGTKTNVDKSF